MDKPYTERTGGSYVRDPKTGQRKLVEATKTAPEGRGGEPVPADQHAAENAAVPPTKADRKGR